MVRVGSAVSAARSRCSVSRSVLPCSAAYAAAEETSSRAVSLISRPKSTCRGPLPAGPGSEEAREEVAEWVWPEVVRAVVPAAHITTLAVVRAAVSFRNVESRCVMMIAVRSRTNSSRAV